MGQWSLPGPDEATLTVEQVATLLHCSTDAVKELVDAGEFPVPIKLGPQSKPLWSGADLAAWLHLRPRLQPKEGAKKTAREEK